MASFNLIDSSVLQRVFMISVNDIIGTGFIVETQKQKYLVTARHLFQKSGYSNSLDILIKKAGDVWDIARCLVYYHDNIDIDVAVIKTNYFDSIDFGIVGYEWSSIILSQDLFMLGFPYGLDNKCYEINRGFPIPFVKKGCLSGFVSGEIIYIDWDNNQGFSGGPVVFRKYEDGRFSDKEYIAGVISGYLGHKMEVQNPDTGKIEGYAEENSGIGYAYSIKLVLDIISKIEIK